MSATCEGCEVLARDRRLRHEAADQAQKLSMAEETRQWEPLVPSVLSWLTRFARGYHESREEKSCPPLNSPT